MENKQYEWAGFKENVDMDELISKKAVIEAIERARANVGHNLERSIGKSIIEILDDVGEDVGKLPSALGTNLAEVGTDVPDNNVGELISRQAALDAYGDWYVEEGTEEGFIGTVKQLLEGLPSAQPEPKWGTWKCSDDLYETAICSCCGYDTNEPWGWTREHFMFCPNCGEKLVR